MRITTHYNMFYNVWLIDWFIVCNATISIMSEIKLGKVNKKSWWNMLITCLWSLLFVISSWQLIVTPYTNNRDKILNCWTVLFYLHLTKYFNWKLCVILFINMEQLLILINWFLFDINWAKGDPGGSIS